MRKIVILIGLVIPIMIKAQSGITIKIEDLKKPEKLLKKNSYQDIVKQLILSNDRVDINMLKDTMNYPYGIVANSKNNGDLVNYGFHPFFNGLYQAYADHRPFVLTPDMMWLLIAQGFAKHVSNNAEELRNLFVNFDGKISLIVRNDSISLDDPDSPWEKVFPQFTKKIGDYTGPELIDILSCNFSTTTPTSKIASQITIMEAMKSYFEYIVIVVGCGIPEIKLMGTTEDWQKVYDKAQNLKKYKLDWWINDLEPLLKEFVNASKGDIDKSFWQKMFKYHTKKKYGAPKIIDGWIVKFFPYDKDGKRNNLKTLTAGSDLPDEIVKVDLKYIYIDAAHTEEIPLELWSGFFGLEQNDTTFALKPVISWMIRKKSLDNSIIKSQLGDQANSDEGIMIRVKSIPDEILSIPHIKDLDIVFIDEINIPDDIAKIKIDRFRMTGKISPSEIEHVVRLLPNTILIINGKAVSAH